MYTGCTSTHTQYSTVLHTHYCTQEKHSALYHMHTHVRVHDENFLPYTERCSKHTCTLSNTQRQSHSDKSLPDEASQVAKKRKTGVSRSPTKLKKAPDRASMTMQELIYYNPSANPMRYVYLYIHVHVHVCLFVYIAYMYVICMYIHVLTCVYS